MKINVLDIGYIKLVESWGSDERIVEAARMSTAKGFLGWGPKHVPGCVPGMGGNFDDCSCGKSEPGDEKLLRYLWEHQHATPFEMAGFIVEVKAPLVVFREWHRHRTQSYNEMSARYVPLPDENYTPSVDRVLMGNAATSNKQAQGSGRAYTEADALSWLSDLADVYAHAQRVYQRGIDLGIPKELARLPVPVARYSVMRASANLRNWLGFLKLRCDPAAQWEIRQYANALARIVAEKFPRTHEVAASSLGLP